MAHQLRGGQITKDPRLDALIDFDERSRDYRVKGAILGAIDYVEWSCKRWLNQGADACAGFGWTHEIAAAPIPQQKGVNNAYAQGLYKAAQKIDEWPGENYAGTSVLAAAKVVKARGFIEEYRWAFTIQELLFALNSGPVVLGIPWHEEMFEPTASGFLRIGGEQSGRHCILARGHIKKRFGLKNRHVLVLHNSWGRSWGVDGAAYLDIDRYLPDLLGPQTEFCVPVRRHRVSI